ncbi:hypothetical protein Leryth_019002 [Lithospermum erythrorhizon]|nr:hypothetical protein Leryth_019002 [Lithospermum erythrorhizon]
MENPSIFHFSIAFRFSLVFVCARFILDRFIFQKLATLLLTNGAPALKFGETTKLKIGKCSESIQYKCTCPLAIFYNTSVDTYFFARYNIVFHKANLHYTYSIAALLTWETRRKDFSVMMSHHVVTVILISYSYMTSFFRVGCIILALHDASDVFLEGAKVFKYSEKSTSYYLCDVLNLSEAYHTALYYIFNTMSLTLLVFHIYWWILIYSMIMRQLKNRGKVGEDIRSGKQFNDFHWAPFSAYDFRK